MYRFPTSFEAKSQAISGIDTNWVSTSFNHRLVCSIPQEFSGPGQGFSSENLYAMAIMNCVVGTFKVTAEKSKLEYEDIQVTSKLKSNVAEDGKPWMDELELVVILKSPSNPVKATKLLEKIVSNSMVINSVKTKVKMSCEII